MSDFSHLDAQGRAKMVDVGHKKPQRRTARAAGTIRLAEATCDLIRRDQIAKGSVLTVAQIAGIQGAKRTAELIPLCHPLPLCHVAVSFQLKRDRVEVECIAETVAQTGVEMEALTGASVAALTLYDMCKAVDKTMRIEGLVLLEKTKS